MSKYWYAWMLYLAVTGDLTDEDITSMFEYMELDGFVDENGEWVYDNSSGDSL